MRRRDLITLLGLAAAGRPLAARGQQRAFPVIGLLSSRSPAVDMPLIAFIRQSLDESGLVVGEWRRFRLLRLLRFPCLLFCFRLFSRLFGLPPFSTTGRRGTPDKKRRSVATGRTHSRLELMNASTSWSRNRLLLALPPRNLKRLLPDVEHIQCHREQILMEADGPLDHVYFPDSGVISVLAVYADGSAIEMATIGREGCTAVQAVFGAKISSMRLFVQISGSAAKMSRPVFARAMASMPPFRTLMYAYVQAFLEQVMVSVACNGAHSLKQRLARWLLMMSDRSDDDALPISQNLLAEMLGVQRPTITNAVRDLERSGLITHGRQQITIRDRKGLIEASCECYQLVRQRITFHLPKTYTIVLARR